MCGCVWLNVAAQVTVGPYLCPLLTHANDSFVLCSLPIVPAGTMNVMIVTKAAGMAAGLFTYQFPLLVTSVSPASGSYAGGQLVTVQGQVRACRCPLCSV